MAPRFARPFVCPALKILKPSPRPPPLYNPPPLPKRHSLHATPPTPARHSPPARPQDMSVNVSSGLPAKLYGKDGKLAMAATLEGQGAAGRVTAAAHPEADAVCRVRPGDMKQKLW